MSFQEICSALAKAEGKKSEVTIGDIREICRILTNNPMLLSGLLYLSFKKRFVRELK